MGRHFLPYPFKPLYRASIALIISRCDQIFMHQGLDTFPNCPPVPAFVGLLSRQGQKRWLSHCFYKKLFIFSYLQLVKKYPICLKRPEYGDFETFFIRYEQAYPQIVWTIRSSMRADEIKGIVKQ